MTHSSSPPDSTEVESAEAKLVEAESAEAESAAHEVTDTTTIARFSRRVDPTPSPPGSPAELAQQVPKEGSSFSELQEWVTALLRSPRNVTQTESLAQALELHFCG
ncbi:MAG: hypothetical protein MK135_17400, partial [Polyangiaceae bacterium]|nr:hypothetical protein [Polyangiaceae bacterium]